MRNAHLPSGSSNYRARPHMAGSGRRAGVFRRRCWRTNRIRQNHESNGQVPSQHRGVSNEVGKCGRLDEIGFLSGAGGSYSWNDPHGFSALIPRDQVFSRAPEGLKLRRRRVSRRLSGLALVALDTLVSRYRDQSVGVPAGCLRSE